MTTHSSVRYDNKLTLYALILLVIVGAMSYRPIASMVLHSIPATESVHAASTPTTGNGNATKLSDAAFVSLRPKALAAKAAQDALWFAAHDACEDAGAKNPVNCADAQVHRITVSINSPSIDAGNY